jgi:putative ABC transport system permease protein
VAGGIVALFLISMVALGLTGVLWQNVTKRTREIGLRRAMGASGKQVNRQILLEVVLLATIALLAGSVIVLQLPILGAFTIVTPAAFSTGFALALATIYALTVLCGLYPSWLASRLQPADALRYE